MATAASVRALIEPALAAEQLSVYDVVLGPGLLRVYVDADGGVDLDRISAATRTVTGILETADPIAGSYTLEVSSPGIERTLRVPAHYQGAVGATVNVKTVASTEGDRRIQGVLEHADEVGITVGGRTITYEQIERARTVHDWSKPEAKASNE